MPSDLEKTEQRNRQLRRLVDLSVTLNSMLDLDALLQLITERATELLACEASTILLYDARQEKLYFAAATGSDPKKLAEIPVPIDKSLAGEIFTTNNSIIVNKDVELDPRHYSATSKHVKFDVHSLVGVPIRMKEQVIGVLEAVNKRHGDFGSEDVTNLSVIASHAGTAINNAKLFREATQRAQHLEILGEISNAVLNNFDIQLTLPLILAKIQEGMEVDAVDVLLLNPDAGVLTFAAGKGFRTEALKQTRLKFGEGNAGYAARERKIVNIPDLRLAGDSFSRAPLFTGEDFVSFYAAPLVAKGEVKGVLEIFHRAAYTLDDDWYDFFQSLANQTAIAIDSAALFKDLQQSNTDLREAYDATIEGWSRALDLRDKETEGHTQRVTEMTIRLALAFGMIEENIIHIRRGALLHDIGKMGVTDSILFKPGELNDDEWAQMRRHPDYASDMLSPIAYLQPALDIPYCHHERWDGTGYPRGLKEEEIPLAARLFTIVDVWDALTYDRPYRKAWPREKTLDYICSQSGKMFDPQVVDVFVGMIRQQFFVP